MSDSSPKAHLLPSWSRAALIAFLIVVVILLAAVGTNAAIGRTIHWDIVSLLAGGGFLGLTLMIHYSR